MATNGLENLTLWLWDNEEGLHITMTTNYNLPTEKRWFFSYAGDQTKNSWRAYNRSQPPSLEAWFDEQKALIKPYINKLQENGFDVYISKQTRNTGTKGRAVAQGFCCLIQAPHTQETGFILQMRDLQFKGEFDPSILSKAQANKGCKGAYRWSLVEDTADAVDPW